MNDAFTAGVEPGGLISHDEIQIMLCYLLDSVQNPMEPSLLFESLAGQGLVNYFEAGAALEELLLLGHVCEDKETARLSLTESGRDIAQQLAVRLPLTVRERALKAALTLLARRKIARENPVEIQTCAKGHNVTCNILGPDAEPLLSLILAVADEGQAKLIKEQFLNDPELLYRVVMAVLTGQASRYDQTGQLIIEQLT